MSRLRSVAKRLAPPIVADAARFALDRVGPGTEWKYLGSAWPKRAGAGWNEPSVVATQREHWRSLARTAAGTDPIGVADTESRPGVAELVTHNTVMTYAYAVGRAAIGRSTLSILDWGGGLGQYGLLARGLFPELKMDYHCYDLSLMTDAGRQLLPEATFHSSESEAFEGSYDLVVASSSLQYSEDWQPLLQRLAGASKAYLLVTRQPFVARAESYVVLQRPRKLGYLTEYPGWVLNRTEFLEAAASARLALRREFVTGEQLAIPRAPEQPVQRGFLFSRAVVA